jgi:hypothetical protein
LALIFGDDGSTSPRTHALIIGVGGYRYLLGGTHESPQTMEHVGLLKQLTSPPRSAVAFAEHLIKTREDWMAPLGSLDLLISPAPDDPVPLPDGWQFSPANSGNIQQAYNDWKQRCDRNDDNMAVFYYCGHGLEKTELHLLAEDFGANPNNPWLGSFAFYATRLAFHKCRAKSQFFFIDACREITSGMLQTVPTQIPLDTIDYAAGECENNLTILGAARNESALGPRQDVSYFTQALIQILTGKVATRNGDGWVIESGEAAKHVTDVIGMINPNEGFKQRCSCQINKNTIFLRVPKPKVGIVLECEPEAANPVVRLSCNAPNPEIFNAQHMGAPWALQVEAGIYEANAQFEGNNFRNVKEYIAAWPMEQIPKLRCSP